MRFSSRKRPSQLAASFLGRPPAVWFFAGLAVLMSGCVVQNRTRISAPPVAPVLLNATLDELLENVRQRQEAIQTINATIQIEPTVTSVEKGELVTYRDVRAFLLIRKPDELRMIGQYPVVRNTAFDLVSDGERFGLYIPSKNRYIVGKSYGGKRSKSALENLRPQHILDALLVEALAPGREEAALEVAKEGQTSYYIVLILQRRESGGWLLSRKLWFEREHLTLARLQQFNAQGELETDARYSSYGEFSGISYPQLILLDRPQDDYGLEMSVTQLIFNQPLGDDKFEMAQPAGAEVVDIEKVSS